MKRSVLLILPTTLLLSGCLGDLVEFFCDVSPVGDDDHCYQSAAVQESDPEDCSKIAGEGFSGSNPPRDKCHLMIAENTGDPSACEGVEGGFMSYSKEDCLEAAFRNHTVEDCKNTENEMACRAAWAQNGKGCGDGFTFTSGTCEEKKPEEKGGGADDDIESKVEQDLKTIADAAGGKYMELLEQAIENEEDEAKKKGLEAYKEFLEKANEKWSDAQATVDTLKDLKKIFLDSYDPSMSVENMKVDKILDPGFFDRLSEKIFGADNPTGLAKENADAESALEVYAKMLERQQENDFLQQGRLGRVGSVVSEKAQSHLQDQLKEGAEDLAKSIAGDAFVAVGIVGDALESFKDQAQKEMFIGLARAYNRRRDALEAQNPGMSPEELHKRTVEQVKDDPYQDNTQLAVVKHGNILENKDCQDEGNPLCIDNRVWWTAMDKTYEYIHRKR